MCVCENFASNNDDLLKTKMEIGSQRVYVYFPKYLR
jgi:hypothetical protein